MSLVRPRLELVIHVLVLLAAASALRVCAQAQKYEGKRVVTIQFVPTEQPLDASELHAILPLKQGEPLRMADVRAAIERLYATGRYKDIRVEAEPYQQGVVVKIVTGNSWFIGNVAIAGNISEPPNAGQLENAARLELGQPFEQGAIKQSLEGQLDLLRNNGLYSSRIHPVYEYDPLYQQVHLRFEVDAGKRARYGTPVFEGDLKLPAAKLMAATGWRRWLIGNWKPVTQSRTRQGISGILNRYQKESRLEAKVRLTGMDYSPDTNVATPKLTIDPGPKIQINIVGAKLSSKVVRREVPVYEERAVDYDLLVEGARNLRNYLQSDGYFEAAVEFKQQRVINDKAAVDYLVNTGKRHRLVYIGIAGNKYFDRHTLRERMYLEPASLLQFRHGRYSESLLRRDEDAIVNLYQSNGFRDAAVTHRIEENYQGKATDMAVLLEVKEGPQYFVNSLAVEGIAALDRARILATLSSAAGQPFSEFSVAVDRGTILADYYASGFPNASFEWSSTPAADPQRVNLRFIIHEGSQQSVRQVLINGLGTTRKSLVDRNLQLNPGDPLSPLAITETQRRLYDLGVFARVDTAVQNPDGETPSKYVLYEMDEARRYSLAAGVGAEIAKIGGCDTCLDTPAGTAGFSPRVSLDLARSNVWGLAHTLSLRGRISNLEQRAVVSYTAPRIRGDDRLTLSFTGIYDFSRDIRTFSSKRQEGSVQLSQRVSKATTLFYRYTYRRVSVDEATLKISPFLIPLLSQPVRVGMVSMNLVQDRRDDPVDPHKGIYTTFDLGLAEHFAGSQRNFLRFLGRNSTYHPIGRKLVLARSTQFGNIYAFRYSGDPLQEVPLAERFFGGGGNSQRGFGENQAGPRDAVTGFPLGGTALFFNQTELRFPMFGDNIGGVLFHDAGNTYTSLSNMSFRVHQHDIKDFDYMVHAVGFGIRYRTPVGPLRVDLGYALNPPDAVKFNGSLNDLLKAGVNPCAVAGRCTPQSVGHFQYVFSIGQTF
jgi:outer membrane protein insertion porin family